MAEVDRAICGDNSDIAKLDSRIKATKDKVTALVTALQPSEKQQAVAKALEAALEAVEDLRKAWKLSPCETALGKLEKSADTIDKKLAANNELRRLRDSSKLGMLEKDLKDLHPKIQEVKKNPYLKGRYTEFSLRYWDAIKTKDEWNIDEATGLIERIKLEMEVVKTIVPELEMLQERIDKAVVQIKKLPPNVLSDKTYKDEVAPLIQGPRTWITKVGTIKDSLVGIDNRNGLETALQTPNQDLDGFARELAKIVQKYPEKQ